jgi:hypothetical protein
VSSSTEIDPATWANLFAVRWARRIPEHWLSLLVLANGCFGALAGLTQQGGWRSLWIVLLLVSFGACGILGWSYHRQRLIREFEAAKLQTSLDSLRSTVTEEYQKDLAYLLDDRLKLLVYLVADAVCQASKPERTKRAIAARSSILHTTGDVVGRAAPQGNTRVNLFQLCRDEMGKQIMKAPPGLSTAGRGDQSIREFKEDSETMKMTLRREPRFVPTTNGVDENGKPIKYGTYLTHPVSAGTRQQIWGALTVDCLNSGDLQPMVDVPMMAILSTLIAMTYRCEAA